MSDRISDKVQLRSNAAYCDKVMVMELPSCQGLFPQVHQTLRLDPDVTTATLGNCLAYAHSTLHKEKLLGRTRILTSNYEESNNSINNNISNNIEVVLINLVN